MKPEKDFEIYIPCNKREEKLWLCNREKKKRKLFIRLSALKTSSTIVLIPDRRNEIFYVFFGNFAASSVV